MANYTNRIMIFLGSVLMCSAFDLNLFFTFIVGLITTLMIAFVPYPGISEGIVFIWLLIGLLTKRFAWFDYVFFVIACLYWGTMYLLIFIHFVTKKRKG